MYWTTVKNHLTKPFSMKNTIRVERAILNITQQDLAEKIGVSRQTINAIESNKYVPSTVLALKMARLFKKNVDELFLLEETDWSLQKIIPQHSLKIFTTNNRKLLKNESIHF